MKAGEQLATLFRGKPPKDWHSAVERLTTEQRDQLWRELDDIAQWAVKLSAYVENFSEHTHDNAVKIAMEREVAVRRAMGYAYPASGVFSF